MNVNIFYIPIIGTKIILSCTIIFTVCLIKKLCCGRRKFILTGLYQIKYTVIEIINFTVIALYYYKIFKWNSMMESNKKFINLSKEANRSLNKRRKSERQELKII